MILIGKYINSIRSIFQAAMLVDPGVYLGKFDPSIIPKPDLFWGDFWVDSLTKLPFGVTNRWEKVDTICQAIFNFLGDCL